MQNSRHTDGLLDSGGIPGHGAAPRESVVKFARRLQRARLPDIGQRAHNRRAARRRL